jgi:DNA (cytosine-5)-methyltransferase 1
VGMPNWEQWEVEKEIQEDFESLKMSKKQFNWYEFFAGGGMARLGLGPHWKCLFANEWSEKKATAYRAYFGETPELKVQDIRSLDTNTLPGYPDLVWASFPCQDLSLAGSGAGLTGERSGTFTHLWKLVRGLASDGRKPKLVVLENVVGAITSHGGKDFTSLVQTIADSGFLVGAMVIDAVHFLPHSRPRLFIIAIDANHKIPAGLAGAAHSSALHPQSLIKAYFGLPTKLKKSWVWWKLPMPSGASEIGLAELIEEYPVGVSWRSQKETDRLISMMSEANRMKLLLAQQSGNLKVGTVYKRTRPISRLPNARRIQRAEIRFDDISGCLRTPVGGSSRQIVVVVHGKTVRSRLLSPREAARLMGVPESYPIPSKYNDAYHLFGDGLVVPVVSWLEKHLLRHLVQAKTMEQVA